MDPYRVVIDDLRTFNFEAKYLRTFHEADSFMAVAHTEDKLIDELYLDGDLGITGTIHKIALTIADLAYNGMPCNIGKIFIHTGNPIIRDWLYSTLNKYYDCEIIDAEPITTDYGEWLETSGDNTP